MGKPKPTKSLSTEEGLDEASSPPCDYAGASSGVPADKVLAALESFRDEMAQSKKDICAAVDTRIGEVTVELKNKISTLKMETQTTIAAIRATMLAHTETIAAVERAATQHSDDVFQLQTEVTRLSAETARLLDKCQDLEGCSRRNNIHLIGVPEGKEGPRPREFVAQLLTDVLSLDQKLLIDRYHHSLRQRSADGQPPCTLILRLHYYHAMEDILRKAADLKDIRYQGQRIQLFPNYPPAVVRRRREFTQAREILRN